MRAWDKGYSHVQRVERTYTVAFHALNDLHDTKAFEVKAVGEKEAERKAQKLAGLGYQPHTVVEHG